jgi:hypothetical protein
VLNQDAFYLLPTRLLDTCIKALGVGNRIEQAIEVASGEEDGVTRLIAPTRWVDTVTIEKLGSYSRSQIETMKHLQKLKCTVDEGLAMCKWLLDEVLPAVDEPTRAIVEEVEAHIRGQYPARIVPGLGNRAEYCYSMLYLVHPPVYLNDAIINAACQRLCNQFPRVRYAGTPDAKPGGARTNHQAVPHSMQDNVMAFVENGVVDVVLVPVNFGNSHWGGILVDVSTKRVLYYDSLNHTHYITTLKKMSMSIKQRLHSFVVQQVEVPIQFDNFSCGIYVCFFFFNQAAEPKKIISKNTLTLRRWELLHYVLLGHGRLHVGDRGVMI